MIASEILAIKSPGMLFNAMSIDADYKQLAKEWHPDISKDPLAPDVFIYIKKLYEAAKEDVRNGIWKFSDNIHLKDTTSSRTYQISYKTHHSFELGDCYISDTIIAYIISPQYKDLVENATKTIKAFKFSSDKMKIEVAKYLPQIIKEFQTSVDHVIIIRKTPDLLLLSDIIDKISIIKDKDRHVAWIISTLLNLNCYLEYAGIAHNNISLDTYFISPKFHSGALLGGWWYASQIGSRIRAVPPSTYKLLPPKVMTSKIADGSVNQELVRALGRELLGNVVGIKLKGSAPDPMVDWLRTSFSGTAFEDYKTWGEVLTKSFRKRRFVEMEI